MVLSARDCYFVARPEGKTPSGFPSPPEACIPECGSQQVQPRCCTGCHHYFFSPRLRLRPNEMRHTGPCILISLGAACCKLMRPPMGPRIDGLIKIPLSINNALRLLRRSG